MKLDINEVENNELDKIKITIEYPKNKDITKLVDYISDYKKQTVIVRKYNELIPIDFDDIILFYSDKRNIFCKTLDNEYKVKNTLYELENQSKDFLRISRDCIINVKHLESFDIGETGKLVVNLNGGINAIVSRRKVKSIMKYIEERSI